MNIETPAHEASDERSARERILEAAISRFAEDGVAGTSLKAIAGQAEVSQALILHHFGSKDILREACDARILGELRAQMRITAEQGAQVDILEAFRRRQRHHPAALPYLARSLAEATPSGNTLVDELAAETLRSIEQGVADGVYVPTDHPRERALVMLIWSLGAVTLHEHVRRLLGADLTGEPADILPYFRGATELLTHGLFSGPMHGTVRDAISRLEQE